ncbi:hypothetical protein [Salisediminibacterium halotolerans]|uniref:hypothetical protein n=1 Tax=Salisediminibacterium halotolerans TaxID=517425 RepID=UPI000EAD4258|nr:hypothetical protein [Salisediminibacterium halotolerans]RLJ71667.1 hypothetical protein BCL39_2338 [Actinophytocola xinjiangensis]RPE86817.1 hypothetical protein EDD67_1679 [Salisediminibacterium halotolerans]TWG32880.1 hypothetical protein BCL52_2333 [Salisediminibacterium halotolerans]GEL06972.1 hypothetical protein SHA02_03880 [Salisediminibacterium halotolerans]
MNGWILGLAGAALLVFIMFEAASLNDRRGGLKSFMKALSESALIVIPLFLIALTVFYLTMY